MVTTASAKGGEGGTDAHLGGLGEQRGRAGRSAAKTGGGARRSSRRRVLGVASGSRIRRGDVQRCCEGGSGVSETQESPAARNFPNSSSPSTAGPGKIPARAGPGFRDDASESFQATRRHCCATWSGLRCGGAAAARRRRGSAPAARRGVDAGGCGGGYGVALGFLGCGASG